MKVYQSGSPVPLQAQLDVLNHVEHAVLGEVSKIDHAWTPVGTRVTYSVADEDGRPTGEEYRLERGDLSALDHAPRVEVSDKEWQAILAEESAEDVLTIAFVDQLYMTVKQQLEAGANRSLVVTVAGVLSGSLSCWGTGCWCWPRRGWYRRCRLLCSSGSC